MSTLKADLEVLGKLSATLHDLGGEVADHTPGRNSPLQTPSVLASVKAADEITRNLIVDTLMKTVTERLTETGDVMANIARHYHNADESNSGEIVAVYSQATGDWTV